MDQRPKLVPMDPKDEMQANIDMLRRELPKLREHAVIVASVKRAYYDALLSNGFSEAQALELCKHPVA